jgi:hypothetical protein
MKITDEGRGRVNERNDWNRSVNYEIFSDALLTGMGRKGGKKKLRQSCKKKAIYYPAIL